MNGIDLETELKLWRDLANAIVEQAAKDYIAALRKLKKRPDNEKALKSLSEL